MYHNVIDARNRFLVRDYPTYFKSWGTGYTVTVDCSGHQCSAFHEDKKQALKEAQAVAVKHLNHLDNAIARAEG